MNKITKFRLNITTNLSETINVNTLLSFIADEKGFDNFLINGKKTIDTIKVIIKAKANKSDKKDIFNYTIPFFNKMFTHSTGKKQVLLNAYYNNELTDMTGIITLINETLFMKDFILTFSEHIKNLQNVLIGINLSKEQRQQYINSLDFLICVFDRFNEAECKSLV